MQPTNNMGMVTEIDTIYNNALTVPIEEWFGVKEVATFIMNIESDGIADYDEIMSTLNYRGS